MTSRNLLPANEQQRLVRLKQLMVVDSNPEPLFDEITKLASEICKTPIALISLIDETRQWFKANTGLKTMSEIHRSFAFCSHAILDSNVMEVADATLDERFKNNPLVTTNPKIRFYAGAPISMPNGENIGTLCVISRKPKELTVYQKGMLAGLAKLVSRTLAMREQAIADLHAKTNTLSETSTTAQDAIISKTTDGIITSWNECAEKMFGYTEAEVLGKPISLLYPQDKIGEGALLMHQISKDQSIQHYETVRLHKSGKPIAVSSSIYPIKNELDKIIGIAVIMRELSAHIEALEPYTNNISAYSNWKVEENRSESNYIREAHLATMQWVSKIERAIEEERLILYCQRIMPLNEHDKEHGEILIRIIDHDESIIAPSIFMPIVERYYSAPRIDRWVVKQIFNWLVTNKNAIDHIESLSINLSGQSVSDPEFHQHVLSLINQMPNIDYSKLCFEITETAAITNIAEASKFIAAMNAHGIKFSLDDFGSGVSSFGYLKTLAVDYLKIDGQFISDLENNLIGQATVRCITEVAKATGKKTIAEWVDNIHVANLLKEMGVDYIQGYLKHKPAPLSHMLEPACSYASQTAASH